MAQKILVTGATGTIGQALVKALHEKQASFVAGIRDLGKAKEKLGSHTELVSFDFRDPSSYESATRGIDKVFLLGPPLVSTLDSLLIPFIDHLKAKNIRRIVYVASLGAEELKEMPFHTVIMDKLKKEAFDYTILKPSFFAQNFKNYEWENITQRGITYVTAGSGKVAFVDVHDIAEVAARVLTAEGHGNKTYELTGPETLSFYDAATILTEVTGKNIVYPNPSHDEYSNALKAAGAPDFIAPHMISVYSLIADNKVNLVSKDVEKITGKKPTSLAEVLQRDFAQVYA